MTRRIGPPGELVVGDEIPTFSRTTDLTNWNRFAAVNDEFVPIHADDEAGREAGFPGALGMGNLQWAYLHNLLRQWLGDEICINRLSCQFRRPNLRGQTVTARGRIDAVRVLGDSVIIDLEVWIEDQGGNVLAPGFASVSIAAEYDSKNHGGVAPTTRM
jgi:acyl dehydratase